MEILIKKAKISDPKIFILRCGYGRIFDRKTNQESFARRLRGDMYPRFHIYIKDGGKSWVFNLHLDQKRPSYGVGHAHSGEYDGKIVEAEAERIVRH